MAHCHRRLDGDHHFHSGSAMTRHGAPIVADAAYRFGGHRASVADKLCASKVASGVSSSSGKLLHVVELALVLEDESLIQLSGDSRQRRDPGGRESPLNHNRGRCGRRRDECDKRTKHDEQLHVFVVMLQAARLPGCVIHC